MSFYSYDQPVPELLCTSDFLIRPLRTTDAQLDYEAVMSSTASLRIWSASDWPQDSFSFSENMTDLAMHEAEHEARIAFGYTIMAPDESRCLGSIYINDLEPLRANYACDHKSAAALAELEARVEFWLRDDAAAAGLDRRLVDALLGWLAREWPFRRVAFGSRRGMDARRRVYEEAGLRAIARLTVPETGEERHVLYAR